MFAKDALHRAIGTGALLAALALPVPASADTNDDAMRTGQPTIHGVITAIHGAYGLWICDDRANDESITLHRVVIRFLIHPSTENGPDPLRTSAARQAM